MARRIEQALAKVLLAGVLVVGAMGGAAARAEGPTPVDPTTKIIKKVIQPTTKPAEPPKPAPPAPKTLEQSRDRYMSGDYAAATGGYEKLVTQEKLRVSAAIGLAEVLAIQGKYAKAVETLRAVEADTAARTDWQIAMAEALRLVGEYEQGLKYAKTAHELRPTSAEAILLRGRLLEMLGRKKQAIDVYQSMEKVIEADKYRTHAPSLVALGQILDRFAILTARKASEQAGNILNNYFQEAYQRVDKKYWPAHVAAAFFALSKHRTSVAAAELGLAAKLNKRVPDVHVGAALIALSQWQFEACMKSVGEALKINPNHHDALVMKGICLMQWRKFEQVAAPLEKVLKTNPKHLDALSLLAALKIRQGKPKDALPYMKRVKDVNAGYAELPNMIGQWLAAGRQFREAEKYYREAEKLAPELASPKINLGRMYMQTGEEAKAKVYFAKAHALDDYRSDVVNFLRLCGRMEDYQVKETDHFIVKVDGRFDAVLLDQVSDEAERIYEEITTTYQYEPTEKTMVEFFPTHQDFSIRITGKGWIGTVGASTGTVIVMVAPTSDPARKTFGTYNWATVLRHEYTHTVTLAATKNRIPHWFTEACAVFEQPDRRGYGAVRQLVAATRSGRLMPIKELDWGFIRPKKAGDRSQAYAQAEWVMEYIIATKGFEAVPKMLRAFRAGKTQEQVLKETFGKSEKEFDKAFGAWAKEDVRRWGYNPDPPPDLKKAMAAAKKTPKDAAAQANLALAQLARRQAGPAEATARKALKLDASNTRALAVLAQVLSIKKKYDEAIQTAEKLAAVDADSRIAPRVLAAAYLQQRSWDKAVYWLETLKQRQHLDPYSYTELAKLYTQFGRPEQALPNLIELHRREMKKDTYARQVAETYRMLGRPDEALAYYRKLTHIDPYEASAYEAMAGIHKNARRYAEALTSIKNVCLLQPESGDAWAKLAMMRYLAAKASKDEPQLLEARKEAEKAAELDPAGYGEQIIEKIDAILKG
jgi:cellulose synthase operon protein C